MSGAYYNEFDPDAAAWLEELIRQGHIAPGQVDTRSIEDVRPDDLRGFTQCHFFAGIGVWSYALRRAGWRDDRPIWTCSCPCQPYSQAGEGLGFDDERHLWPHFHHLAKVRKPPTIVGEQVASKAVDVWIDLVQTDVEALDYAFGCIPFPSASVGAPHIRDRNYWMANANSQQHNGRRKPGARGRSEHSNGGAVGRMGHASSQGLGERQRQRGILGGAPGADQGQATIGAGLHPGRMADTSIGGWREERQDGGGLRFGDSSEGYAPGFMHGGADNWSSQGNGYWSDADWLGCRDGKWRPVEPGTFPLADGASARVVRLRGYGNAVNAQAAQAWVETVMECIA